MNLYCQRSWVPLNFTMQLMYAYDYDIVWTYRRSCCVKLSGIKWTFLSSSWPNCENCNLSLFSVLESACIMLKKANQKWVTERRCTCFTLSQNWLLVDKSRTIRYIQNQSRLYLVICGHFDHWLWIFMHTELCRRALTQVSLIGSVSLWLLNIKDTPCFNWLVIEHCNSMLGHADR